MLAKQAIALGDLLSSWAHGDLREVTVTLRLSPGTLDALPSGYIAGEIVGSDGRGTNLPRFWFGISPEGEVSS